MGGNLFQRIAAATQMKKRQLQSPDKIPRKYNRRPLSLGGKVNLDITFNGVTMNTPVYIKLDDSELLLLAEGVCRQLNIITYHLLVGLKREGRPPHSHDQGVRRRAWELRHQTNPRGWKK